MNEKTTWKEKCHGGYTKPVDTVKKNVPCQLHKKHWSLHDDKRLNINISLVKKHVKEISNSGKYSLDS